MRPILFFIFLLIPVSLLALVDYSDTKNTKKSFKPMAESSVESSSGGSFSINYFDAFALDVGVESLDVNRGSEKVNFTRVNGFYQFPFSVYLDMSYWWASSMDTDIAPTKSDLQKGNGTFIAGFNWFRIGNPENMAGLDIYGGLRVGEKKSDFASSRTDKIFGVEALKRFYSFALGLTYQMDIVGAPKTTTEKPIGNVQTLGAALAWAATDDIAFEFEAKRYMVSDAGRGPQVKWSQLTPQLNLSISRVIELQFGARFLTQALTDNHLDFAKRLWVLDGAYGNSIFAKLKIGF